MPARSIGSGTISFGLVSIPVKLFSANESSAGVSFNLLHAKCGTRVKQQYVCPKDNEVVPRDQMVKGYEFSKDQYVTFTDDELKALSHEGTRAIEISEFVPAEQIDPLYFDGAYYLGPDKGGEKAYRLLREAMNKTGRAGIARWVTRGKQNLVLLRSIAGGIVMMQLHYAQEVRPITEVPIQEAPIKDQELDLAVQFVGQISSEEFQPEKYQDEVTEQVRAAIDKKVQGQEIVTAPEQPKGQIIDLMEALKASIAKAPAAAGASGKADADQADGSDRKPAKRAPRKAAESDRKKAQG